MSEVGKEVPDVKGNDLQVGPEGINRAGYLSKAERPYAGDLKGRIEDAQRDPMDAAAQSKAEAIEKDNLRRGQEVHDQRGNVGYAGNYTVSAEVER